VFHLFLNVSINRNRYFLNLKNSYNYFKTFLRQALKSWNTARPEKGFRASDVQGFRVPDWLGPLFWFLVLVWVWSEQQIINDILNATPLAGKKREKGHNHKSADDWATISGWTWTWTPTREPDSLRAQHEDATPFNEICLKTWKTFVIPSFLQDTQQKATKVGTQQKVWVLTSRILI